MFNPKDRVVCIHPGVGNDLVKNKVYEVISSVPPDDFYVQIVGEKGILGFYKSNRFQPAVETKVEVVY